MREWLCATKIFAGFEINENGIKLRRPAQLIQHGTYSQVPSGERRPESHTQQSRRRNMAAQKKRKRLKMCNLLLYEINATEVSFEDIEAFYATQVYFTVS